MSEFKVGDVVALKSGGPEMTVSEVKDRVIWTQWFTDTAEPTLNMNWFDADVLRKVKE